MIRYLLERRDDLFVYYLLPDPETSGGSWTIDHDWLIRDPRVRYVPVSVDPDRMKEYARVNADIENAVAYNGPLWDFDVLLTARSTQVPTLRMWMSRSNRAWTKAIVIDDEFPIMSFKNRVCQPDPRSGDLLALTGYMAADLSLIFSFASTRLILKEARSWFPPSRVRELSDRLVAASSIRVDQVHTRSAEQVKAVAAHERPFAVAYTQRVSRRKSERTSKEPALSVFLKQWVYWGGRRPIRFLLTSNSRVTEDYEKHEHLEVKRCPREEFWRVMREEADLILALSDDEDYPLSLIEPVMLGVPGVFNRAAWSEATFGKDYPFLVSGESEAYAVLKAFYEDYEGMYAKFRAWSEDVFALMMAERNDRWFPLLLDEFLDRFEQGLAERIGRTGTGESDENEVVAGVLDWARGKPDFLFADALKGLHEAGTLRHLYTVYQRSRHRTSYSMGTAWNEYRLKLKYRHGLRDAGAATGHLAWPG